jgi:formate dehydrogenase subunit gamma
LLIRNGEANMADDAWTPQKVMEIILAEADRPGALLPVLRAIDHVFGHVPDAAVPMVAGALNLSRAEVHGVLTFYADFRREPPPRHVLKLCRAEACQARNGEALAADAQSDLAGRDDIALEAVYCLGLCASGPAGMLDGRPVARLDRARLAALIGELGP